MLINAGMVLLADQVAKLIAREDDGFAVRGLAHLHRGLTPLGVGITADFSGQRAVTVFGAVLRGFPRRHAPEGVIFIIQYLRRQIATALRVANKRSHLLRGVVVILRLPPGVILLTGQQPGRGVVETPLLVIGVGQRHQAASPVEAETGDMPCRVGGFCYMASEHSFSQVS